MKNTARTPSGSSLIYIIVTLTVASALAAGMMKLTSSTTWSELNFSNKTAAKELAMSGINYFAALDCTHKQNIKTLADASTANTTWTLGSGKFTLYGISVSSTATNTTWTLSSKGTLNSGTSSEVDFIVQNYQMTYNNDGVSGINSCGMLEPDPGSVVQNQPGVIPASGKINNLSITFSDFTGGVSYKSPYNKSSVAIPFGNGIRVYFSFKFGPTSNADGFVMAIKNAALNTSVDASGATVSGDIGGPRDNTTSHGGWLAYAGPGPGGLSNSHNMGIRPPKIGLEFDTWANGLYSGTGSDGTRCCSYNKKGQCISCNEDCDDDGRNDLNSSGNGDSAHMAYVFWGYTTNPSYNNYTAALGGASINATTATYCPDYTQDDNVHCWGGINTLADPDPWNPGSTWCKTLTGYSCTDSSGTACKGYYSFGTRSSTYDNDYNGSTTYSPTLVGTTHGVRMEITRSTTPVGSSDALHQGMYKYEVKTWYNKPRTDAGRFADITQDYTATATGYFAPSLSYVLYLTSTDHTNFNNFVIGYTLSTGGELMNITLSSPKLGFK